MAVSKFSVYSQMVQFQCRANIVFKSESTVPRPIPVTRVSNRCVEVHVWYKPTSKCPLHSRHKCTGVFYLGSMPIVTTMPQSAAFVFCVLLSVFCVLCFLCFLCFHFRKWAMMQQSKSFVHSRGNGDDWTTLNYPAEAMDWNYFS